MVGALHAADISVGCMVMVGPVKSAADRPWSPWRGPARDVQRPPRVWRSGARGEALWTPVGDLDGRSCSGALGGDGRAPHRRAFQLDPVRAVNDAVEDRVTERGIGDHLVPFTDGDLAGDQQ